MTPGTFFKLNKAAISDFKFWRFLYLDLGKRE